MAAVTRLDSHGLISAGQDLAGTGGHTYTPATASGPGVDETSTAAAAHLNAVSAGLAARLNHGSALRAAGGRAVMATAAALVGLDEDNARSIANFSTSPGSISGLLPTPTIPAPTIPEPPAIPAVPSPLPGEAQSRALYGGPGSSGLHAFADQWTRYAAQLDELSGTLHGAAGGIDASWDRGEQNAGNNVRRHGDWATHMSRQARGLARTARTIAGHFETAKASTPSPQEFQQVRTDLNNAIQRFNASRGLDPVAASDVQTLTAKWQTMQTETTTAAGGYAGNVQTASLDTITGGAGEAPPITHDGDAVPLDSTWKPGDPRHNPYISPDGKPPKTGWWEGPKWTEIGPGSGIFVRSDEIPGAIVKAPGELGPPGFYDGSGNAHEYIELMPGSGVWVPDTEFPDAQFRSPGELGPWNGSEYIPGSGIWLPSDDLTREPLAPPPTGPPPTLPQSAMLPGGGGANPAHFADVQNLAAPPGASTTQAASFGTERLSAGSDPYWDWLHDFRDGSEVEVPVDPGGAAAGPGAGPRIPDSLI